jgi:signal transduction histidine kinase
MTQVGSISYTLPPALALATGLAIIAVVMKWAPPSPRRRAFFIMVSGLLLWGVLTLGMRLSTDPDVALLWQRWLGIAVLVISLGFYRFSLEYASVFGRRRGLTLAYVAVALFAIAAPSGLLVKDIRIEEYGYAPVIGPLAIPAALAATTLLLASVYTLLQRYRAISAYEERNRLLFISVAASLPLLGAILDGFTNLPPASTWTSIVFCVICSVALLEYRLLDIPRVARRTLTYLVLGVMVALPYVAVLLALQKLVGERMESTWGYVLSVLFLALFLRPLYGAAQNLVDRLFFRDRYDALRALEQFGKASQQIVDVPELSSQLTRLVADALHATSTCLFLPSEEGRPFELVHSEGLTELPEHQHLTLSSRTGLIRWLSQHPEMLSPGRLDIEPQLQSLSQRELRLLEAIDADVLVPITSRGGRLSGLLVLGSKRSRGSYSGEDRRLLEALGRQLAMSLENARIYGAAVRARRDLESWLDGMSDYVVIVGADGTVRFLNRSAREGLGLHIGEPCWSVLGAEEPSSHLALEGAWREGTGSTRTFRHIGERDYEVIAAALRDPDGEPSLVSVLRDVTETRRFEAELRRSREELRELAAHVESVREEERTGIARELHDELGQALTALKLDLSWAIRHQEGDPPAVREKLLSLISLTESTIKTVQRLSSELRPGLLDDLGLVAALEWLASDFQRRNGVECIVSLDEELEFDAARSTALFRICQESLTNVSRHANATSVRISLHASNSNVVLSVVDNGKGIAADETAHRGSFGIIGMTERARALGGHVAIDGVPGEGTRVEVTLPLG